MVTDAPSRPTRPPGPKGSRLTGNIVRYDRDRIGFLLAAQREYGDCFSFDRTTVVVCDPGVVHDLFIRTNTDFLAEAALFASAPDVTEMMASAQTWMEARQQGRRGFHRSVATAHSARLVAALDRTVQATAAAPIDVSERMQFFSGVAVADYCLGADADGVPDAIAANVNAVLPILGSSTVLPRWVPTPRTRRFVAARRRSTAILSDAVVRRRAAQHRGQARDLLDQLLGVDEPPLTDRQIVDFIRVNLVASFGVPGATMAWTVRELDRRPDILERLSAEAIVWRGGIIPTLAELPYAEALVKEMLRAYPPTWLIGRVVARPTTVAGWALDPGDTVMFSPYLIHRDPRWWEDPARIDPQRWLRSEAPHARHAYLPFGAGPRVCLGAALGMLQLVLAISWLAYAYDIEVVGEAAPRSPTALLMPEGLRARFHSRIAGSP